MHYEWDDDKAWLNASKHKVTKEEEAVPAIDIERAKKRKCLFEENPEAHTYVEEEKEDGEEDGSDS